MDTVNSLPRFLQPDSPKNHELNSSQVNLNLIFLFRLACLLPNRSKTSMDSPNLTVEILISGLIDYLVTLRIIN